MSEKKTFECPHAGCEAQYPVMDKLFDKVVRCSTCRQPFRLKSDGSVKQVKIAAKTAPKKTPQAPVAQAAPALKPKPVQKPAPTAPAPQPKPTPHPKPAASRPVVPVPRTVKQTPAQTPTQPLVRKELRSGLADTKMDALRKSVSASLKVAADHAISSESSERKAKSQRISKQHSTREHVAVLDNQAGRERTIQRLIIVACLCCVVGAYYGIQLLMTPSDIGQALRVYSAPTLTKTPHDRQMVYLKRHWLYTINGTQSPLIILNVREAIVGELRSVDLTPVAAAVHTAVADKVHTPALAMWIDENSVAAVNTLWAEYEMKPPIENFYTALRTQKIAYTTYAACAEIIKRSGVDAEAQLLYAMLLMGSTDARGKNTFAENIYAGTGPTGYEIHSLNGTNGREYFCSVSNQETFRKVRAYTGNIVRFTGAEEWRLCMMQRVDYTYVNPLLEKDQLFQAGAFRKFSEQQARGDEEADEYDEEVEE